MADSKNTNVNSRKDSQAQPNIGAASATSAPTMSTSAQRPNASNQETYDSSSRTGARAEGVKSEPVRNSESANRSDSASRTNDFGFGDIAQRAKEFFNDKDIPAVGREYLGKIDAHARSNPWLHIGLVGAAGLALGYFVGRSGSGTESIGGFGRGLYNEGGADE